MTSDALDFRILSEILARHVGGETVFLRSPAGRSMTEKGIASSHTTLRGIGMGANLEAAILEDRDNLDRVLTWDCGVIFPCK